MAIPSMPFPLGSVIPTSLALRDQTRPHHERAEHAVDMPSRVTDRAAYGGLLEGFYGVFSPLETRLAVLDWTPSGLSIEAYLRADLLQADLEGLGIDPETVPLSGAAPSPATLSAGFGSLYVLVGSSLGGQVLAREADRALGLGASGTRFLRSDGRDVGRLWRAFKAALDVSVDTPEAQEEAVRAAADTFDVIQRWVARPASLIPTDTPA